MMALWIQNLIHLVRSRLLVFIVLFSCAVQYFAVKLVNAVTFHISTSAGMGNENVFMKETGSYFVAIVAANFAGGFLAAVYGAWIAPYLHRGSRSALTHMLPITRWAFPAAHALTFAVLLVFQLITLLWALGTNVGWNLVLSASFPWKGVLLCLFLQSISFYVILFGAAATSMMIGSLSTFFLTNMVCSFLVGARAIILLSESRIAGEIGTGTQMSGTGSMNNLRWILDKLPPLGDLFLDLKKAFETETLPTEHLAMWAIWLAAFVVWFRWRLNYPHKVRSSEG